MNSRTPNTRQLLVSSGIKLLIAVLLLSGSYFVVNHSKFYYLFIGNVLLIFGLAFLIESLAFLLFGLFKKFRGWKIAVISTSRFTFIIVFIADFILGLTGVMQTYSERADGNYFSIAQQEKRDSWYWVHTPNTEITNQKKEFLFSRNVNSLGISEKEISKDKGLKRRIIAIGDSFTEGVGESYEDSWVKKMEKRWKSKNIQTINAGIGGSDPVYEFVLYRDKLIKYQPDILIMTINFTDITDIVSRGGFERFHADGTAGREAPCWEWIYASNHLFRMIMHNAFGYNSSLVKNMDAIESKKNSVEIIKDVMLRLKELTIAENTDLLIVFQPSINDFSEGVHKPFFGQQELKEFLKSKNIYCLDASSEFKNKGKTINSYYYPLDSHFNKKGYALFGRTVYEKLEELELLN